MESPFLELTQSGRSVLVTKSNIAFIEVDTFHEEKRIFITFNFTSGKDNKPHRELFDDGIDALLYKYGKPEE